jgi:hypothetical protein
MAFLHLPLTMDGPSGRILEGGVPVQSLRRKPVARGRAYLW